MHVQTYAATPGDVQSDGHNLTFVANTGRAMDNGQTVDLETLTVPLMDGSTKLVSELSEQDSLALPLLIDHMFSLTMQAGKIVKLWIDEHDGLMAKAKLSDTESGKLVLQLASEGMLTNSFSIDIEYMTAPGKDNVIHDGNLQEISVVFKGMDPGAVYRSLNSKEGGTMDIDKYTDMLGKSMAQYKLSDGEKSELLSTIRQIMQDMADSLTKAVNAASEDDSDNGNDDNGDDDNGTGKSEPPAEPAQSSNAKSGTVSKQLGKRTLIINSANDKVEGQSMSDIAKFSKDRKTYLDSPQAFADYAKFIFDNPNDQMDAGMEVAKRWGEFARKKMGEHASFGIDNESVESMLPTSVVDTINDVFNTQGTGVWQTLNKTGLDVPPTIGENEIGLDSDEGRAHGYPVADYGTEKKEERISIATRTYALGYVYKYISMNKGDLRRTKNPGALLRYLLSEIPARLIQTLERAATINSIDPTAYPNDWADMSMFKSIFDDSLEDQTKAGARTIPGNRFALTYTQRPNERLLETFRRASGKVKAAGPKSLITTEDTLADIEWGKDDEGRPLIPIGAPINTLMGVTNVFTPEWWTERDNAKALGIIYVGGQYSVFGDNSIEAYTNFALRTNKNEFLQEIYTGGGLRTIKSAVIIKAAPKQSTKSTFGYTGTERQNAPTEPTDNGTVQGENPNPSDGTESSNNPGDAQ